VAGICCVGAPLRDHRERLVGSISIATIVDLFDAETLGIAVLETAVTISNLIGWTGDATTLYTPVPDTAAAILGAGYSRGG
jgi:hypothetical protein